MYDNKILNNIVALIRVHKKSLVLSHQNPDGDTLGSMLALGMLLKKLGHTVDCVNPDHIPKVYEFLPGSELVRLPEDKDLLQKSYELAFTLDCGSVKRLGLAKDLYLSTANTVNIDHHVSNENYGKINWIVADAVSTGQLVFWLAQELKAKITKEIATLLYVTLLTDTGCFSNSNTSAQAMMWGAELIKLGASSEDIYKKVFLERPFKSVKIFGSALNDLELLEDGQIALTLVNKSTMENLSAGSEDTEDIVDYMMRIKGVKVGIFLREDVNETKVSLRSNTDFDVSKIAVSLGGGGHKKASGINVKLKAKEVKDLVLNKVLEEFRNYSGKNGKE